MMDNNLKKLFKHSCFIGWKHVTVVISLILLAGCNATGGAGQVGTPPTGATGLNMAMPPEVTETKELLDTAVLETIERKNPFSSLLFNASSNQVTDNGTPIVENQPTLPVDPFENLSLAGIIYRGGSKSLAIFITPGEGSKILHEGDLLWTNSSPSVQLKVSKIDKKNVFMQVLNPPPDMPPQFQTKTFDVVSLVGFKGSGSSSSGAKTSAMPEDTKTTGQQSSNSDVSAIIEELKKSMPATETGSTTGKQQ